MKEYKNSTELLDYIISKGISVNNKEDALNKIDNILNIMGFYKNN